MEQKSTTVMPGGGARGQCTDTVLLLRPNHFGYNDLTAGSNVFQTMPQGLPAGEIHDRALREFERFRKGLEDAGVTVLVFDDTEEPHTPDAVFPNNWFSTHEDGTLVLYPMEGENRRLERRRDILDWLRNRYGYRNIIDMTGYEHQGRFLEGTGSMVLDRTNLTVYACVSSRTDRQLVSTWAERLAYNRVVTFRADVKTNEETGFEIFHPVYHTNVMLALGESAAVICAETIVDERERGEVMSAFWQAGYNVVEITVDQLHRFAGNMLQLRTRHGALVWVMSTQAHDALTPHQRKVLTADGSMILHSPLDTIELVGGGSARCMLAEIFPPALR